MLKSLHSETSIQKCEPQNMLVLFKWKICRIAYISFELVRKAWLYFWQKAATKNKRAFIRSCLLCVLQHFIEMSSSHEININANGKFWNVNSQLQQDLMLHELTYLYNLVKNTWPYLSLLVQRPLLVTANELESKPITYA